MNQVIKISDEVVSRNNLDGTVVIMKLDDNNFFFKIDHVAAQIWKDLSCNKPMDQIKNEIISAYDVTSEVLNNDIKNLLHQLETKKLILINKCE